MDDVADGAARPVSTVTGGEATEGSESQPAADPQSQLLRAAVEGGLDGMVVVSSDGVIISSNAKFQEIWPIPAEVVASGDDEAALASVLDKLADPDAFLARVHELYDRAEGSARDELLLLDGRVLDRYGTALPGPDGQYIGWAWYFRDVTAERAAAVDAGRLSALVDVAQALAEAQTEIDVLSVVTGPGASVVGAQGAVLCLFEQGTATIRSLTTTFFDEEVSAEVAELPLDFPLPMVHVAVTGEPLFLADREEVVRLFPGAEELYRSARTEGSASVPLISQAKTIGSLSVAFETPNPWRPADQALLLALAALTAQALDRLRAEKAEQEATQEIRRLSETLQRSLLTALPQSDTLQLAARYQPAARDAEVGGDWYDAFSTRDGTTTLVVGDVAGHDSSAAAAMAQVRNVLRGVAQTVQGSPGVILSALDSALARLEVTSLATAIVCHSWPDRDDAAGRRLVLRWSNAGHPAPLVVHPEGTVDVLAHRPEMLLGVYGNSSRTDHEVVLAPGATVLLYTDGLVERRRQSLDEGLERLRAAAAELYYLPVDEFCDALLDRLITESEDDVVLLVARVKSWDASAHRM
ncbi:serine phosphatase RsbU (regulator of sigma subunit) [Blastococcus colisei]|uniref:Serine phosphatase RsbU (Regulator of sigma subunit) n=2 Tax=Blastococcus colisei TaxID=1564162 RepID=A0A543PGH7_9ACTN|nr:serine phosphatase RsbU (regulator of sigma subunit) [Blastococcus colisei]